MPQERPPADQIGFPSKNGIDSKSPPGGKEVVRVFARFTGGREQPAFVEWEETKDTFRRCYRLNCSQHGVTMRHVKLPMAHVKKNVCQKSVKSLSVSMLGS